MAKTIPGADRISNKYPPLSPTDKTELNADNVMLILDNLVNGQYRFKVYRDTYANIIALTGVEEGELFYATDKHQYVGWDGTDFILFG